MNTIAVSETNSKPGSSQPTARPAEPIDRAIEVACARIAPSWPLDRFIAVNPFWPLIGSPLPQVAAELRALSGAQLLMPRSFYRAAYESGALRDEHLQNAIDAAKSDETPSSLRASMAQEEPAPVIRARVADTVDSERGLDHAPSWRSFITQSVSQFCAAYFDEGQAALGPARDGGLYASWLHHASRDRSPTLLMGASSYRVLIKQLPASARELVPMALAELGVEARDYEAYLWSLLLDINGWASWCAYQRWTARLRGLEDESITDLLAIRLAWEWLVYRIAGDGLASKWASAMRGWPNADAGAAAARASDWLLQAGLEGAWRAPLLRALPKGLGTPRPLQPALQAVFCIDVRSEVFRRALEATAPAVQTLGFAGFFGLPIEYRPLVAPRARPQLPGLLAPRFTAGDTGVAPEDTESLARRLEVGASARVFKTDAVSTFTFVEALGLSYGANLLKESLGLAPSRHHTDERASLSPAAEANRKPRLLATTNGEPLSPQARCDLAFGILRGMSLTRTFAPIVLLVGHGSATRNNPHAAGLDCGACCGQTGEVNARVAAALLNDRSVRADLAQRGVSVPESTRFVAALHNTTTDDIELFELDELPASHAQHLETARAWLVEAGGRARAERAELLGLEGLDSTALSRAFAARSSDWAQVRPEWGLANNAAFIVAPREHCRHLDLKGRSFLHDYRHEEDEGYAVLELIMTAPMVVAHWINFQYYASTVDNLRYGSGNKVLHNVVGGHVGVFEGNTGDLRIGLPLQSLHDGSQWLHQPLRLSVFIEAPRFAIDAILKKHEVVHDLVSNGWLSLFQIEEKERAVYSLQDMKWQRFSSTTSEDRKGVGYF